MPVDRRTLPPRCAICGYYMTDNTKYAGYRCICPPHRSVTEVLAARAATGMCDSDEMAATMDEARAAISARIDKAMADTQAAREIEFADQHEDWIDWQWSIGDLGL